MRTRIARLPLLITAIAFTLTLLRTHSPAAEDFPFPDAFTKVAVWDSPDFLGLWEPQSSPSKLSHRTFSAKPVLFGHQPHVITGLFNGDQLASISIHFLDSGAVFGYSPQGAKAPDARARQKEFDNTLEEVRDDVVDGLRTLSGKRKGEEMVLAKEPLLRQKVLLFSHGDLVSRLIAAEGHLVKLTLFRSMEEATNLLSPALREGNRRDLEEQAKIRAFVNDHGDHLLEDIPLFPQGDRAYCGVSTLAMAMQYLGLNLETEEYAAASGIKYGTAKGAEVREAYLAAAKEAGMRIYRSTRFDFDKAKESIDAGIPIVVWRRFTFERDFVHKSFSRRFAEDKTATLPEPDSEDRATWPGDVSYTHSSVITGYNPERREVIFTESWGEYARDRRMRVEEMEGTAYYTFYFRF